MMPRHLKGTLLSNTDPAGAQGNALPAATSTSVMSLACSALTGAMVALPGGRSVMNGSERAVLIQNTHRTARRRALT